MFEVTINKAYSGAVWRFNTWAEVETFSALVLHNGVYEANEKTERLSVTIREVEDER